MSRCRVRAGVAAPAGLALAVLFAPPWAARADVIGDERPVVRQADEELPPATSIQKITWTTSEGVTRIRFAAPHAAAPKVALVHPEQLRVDLTAADARLAPRSVAVGTPQVRAVVKVPEGLGVLPEGVSARFLVQLAEPGLAWSVRVDDSGFDIFVGNEDKAGQREVLFDQDSWYADLVRAAAADDVVPVGDERLAAPAHVVVRAAQAIRTGPSTLHPALGALRPGETRLIDGRRGEWLHLGAGGWFRQEADGPESGRSSAARDGASDLPAAPPREVGDAAGARSAAVYSVVTLGTNLSIDLHEIPATDELSRRVARLVTDRVQVARLSVRVPPGTSYEFYLPPKAGRLRFELESGLEAESLAAPQLPTRDDEARRELAEIFAAEPVVAGEQADVLVPIPPSIDLTKVRVVRVDVGGQLHRMFRIPGSGE